MNYPEGFEESKKNPAVIVAHPGGGVKERRRVSTPESWRRQGSSRLRLTLPTKGKARVSLASSKTPTSGRKTSVR